MKQCDLCSARPNAPLYRFGNFSYVKCSNCGLVYLESPPPREELDAYYRSGYHLLNDPLVTHKLARVQRLVSPGAQILDVGCGQGDFLNAARIKYNARVVGLEASEDIAKAGREQHGLKVVVGDIADVELREPLDLVTFWHSIEHLPSPAHALSNIYSQLNPGGTIAVATPNIASLQARVFGAHWFHLDPSRHLYLFSTPTLTRLLEQTGFKVETIYHYTPRHNFYGWVGSLYRILGLTRSYVDKTRADKLRSSDWYAMQGVKIGATLPALLLVGAEWILRRGGTIEVVARK